MRIVAGDWRGRKLAAPTGLSTRPTSDRTREAIFSMLVSRLGGFSDLRVLDLFAGSGALGLEALSRGAGHATFVERDRAAVAAIRANIDSLGAAARTSVLQSDVIALGRAPDAHHIVFCDAPYGEGLTLVALTRLAGLGWFAPHALIAVETAKDEPLDLAGFEELADRQYGKARIRLLRYGVAGAGSLAG